MSEFRANLKREFEDKDYRDAYAEDYLNTFIAVQIKVLREQRGMTQSDLAEKIGTKQAGVSRLENVNYDSWKTQTLKKIARALDVRLRISFETFGTLIKEAENFCPESLKRPNFASDPTFLAKENQMPALSAPVLDTNVFIRNIPVQVAAPTIRRWHEDERLASYLTGFPEGPVRILASRESASGREELGNAGAEKRTFSNATSDLGSILTANANIPAKAA